MASDSVGVFMVAFSVVGDTLGFVVAQAVRDSITIAISNIFFIINTPYYMFPVAQGGLSLYITQSLVVPYF